MGHFRGKRDGTESTNHRSLVTTSVHCAVSRELSAGVHGHIQSASIGGGAARRWLARGGRRKVGAFSSLLPKSEWPKAKSLKEKVRALESIFQKVYTLGALALQDFSHRLLKVGHFQLFRDRDEADSAHRTRHAWRHDLAKLPDDYLLYMALGHFILKSGGYVPTGFQKWWVQVPTFPPPPWRRPWLGTCRGNQLLFVKTRHADTTTYRRNELYFVKTRFVRQHQRKSLFTPTSAKISTNQWYYFLSFIGRIAQTHRTQNSSNTNFSHLAFFSAHKADCTPLALVVI